MKINCDIGERGAQHPVDRELMRQIDIANIACGGHAGDAESIAAFRELAEQYDVEISAHLAYPDRENFGRFSMEIEPDLLSKLLDEQLQRMPGVSTVKFHGALYNDSVINPVLAGQLAAWLLRNNISTLIAPAESEMALAADKAGMTLLAEVFADRRYHRNERGQLELVSRSDPQAVFETVEEALQQCRGFMEGRIRLLDGEEADIQADTLCIHSDSDIALPLVQALHRILPPFDRIHPGLSAFVTRPAHGRQSVGVSPGGPQDRFSFETGQALLNAETKQSLEFILPPVLKVTRPARFILTGAHFENSRIERNGETLHIPHATVFRAEPGDLLRFGKVRTGLRGYLSWDFSDQPEGKCRPPLNELITWNEPNGRIRILSGPEAEWLNDPETLISKPWEISPKSDPMGIRLDNPGTPLDIENRNMISAPVTDGTVQLTPAGPIVLMRHRQTTGGYPRIANVIEVDIDRLAQFRPGETVHFEWTDIDTARDLLKNRNAALEAL